MQSNLQNIQNSQNSQEQTMQNPNRETKDQNSSNKLTKGQKKKEKEKKKKQLEKKLNDGEQLENQVKTQKKQSKQTKGDQKKDKNKKNQKINPAVLLIKQKQEQRQKNEEKLKQMQKQAQQQAQRRRVEEQANLVKEKMQKLTQIRIKKQTELAQKNQRIRKQLQRQKNGVFDLDEQERQKTEEQIKADKQRLEKNRKKQEHNSVLKNDHIYFELKQGQYRSPICAILGHVDTGKTTLLDKIRKTNVQQGEAGGITQQIGATFFPHEKLKQQVSKCQTFINTEVNVPGLLIIDTPGHQSFSNLRSRGSSLCDIAILVIDLHHGLQNQTLESMQLLKKKKIPFIVALNKIDRSYGWQSIDDTPSFEALKRQKQEAIYDFECKLKKVIIELNQKGYNAALYWQNTQPQDYISLVPTSGITGEGIPDLLSLIVKYSLTIPQIQKKIKVKKDRFTCTVMQVKMMEGYGTTIDCILIDGKIKKDDQIVLLGISGPIVTKVKAILTPHPMKEMRVKDEYLHHKEINAANGIKIAGIGLDEAVAGTPLFVANALEQIQNAKIMCINQLSSIKKTIKLQKVGVGVAASTLGSLQALLVYLAKQKVPVSYVTVGPVSKEDVMKAMKSVLSQLPQKRKKQYCCMLVFDQKVLHDAKKYAQENHIKIFTAKIIYHLTDFFTKFVQQIRLQRKEKEGNEAVFPCILKQVATFRKKDPIVIGVDVQEGVLKVGTPITLYKKDEKGDTQIKIGTVESIQHNHKKLKQARKQTGSVAICLVGDSKIQSGRDFEQNDMLVSKLTRRSINCLQQHFSNQLSKEDLKLITTLKKYFSII